MARKPPQTFNDGIVSIYAVSNQAEPGKMPKEKLYIKKRLRYKERTVGLIRMWTAKQDNVKISHLFRVPLQRDISTQDVAVLPDGNQYKIKSIQYPEDIVPPVMDLTLEEVVQKYEYA